MTSSAVSQTKDPAVVVQMPARQKPQKIPMDVLELAERLLEERQTIRLLEAGCGTRSYTAFMKKVESWGIDISAQQLEKNEDMQNKILGDIQDYPLPLNHFDVVVCWDVLEHLPRPSQALKNMFSSVAPNGMVILGFPNMASFKGLVTKFTPLWFHTLFYKRIMRYTFRPFETYLRPTMLPRRVIAFAAANGLAPEYFKMLEGDTQKAMRKRFLTLGALFALTQFMVSLFTIGRGPSLYKDYCVMVLRKNAQPVKAQGLKQGADSSRLDKKIVEPSRRARSA
jgi:2-polyprenyl-3-methyl-5-hydroxy-6-metoxy-1,4-benzoquinol methylase